MTPLPHDASDLYLAPIALELDARLEELGTLTAEELVLRVALAGDLPSETYPERKEGLLRAATELIDMHHWNAGITERGLQIQHGKRSIVLALPRNVHDFINGVAANPA